jgi:hypothetical protein
MKNKKEYSMIGTLCIFAIVLFFVISVVNKYNNNVFLNKQNKSNINIKKIPGINTSDKLNDIEEYTKSKRDYNEAKYKEDYDLITSALKKYIEYAMKLNKIEVAIWQYNNLAYYNIMEFCYRTDYGNKKDIIYKMKNGEAKDNYIKECKSIFILEYKYIDEADKSISQAYVLNNESKEINEQRTKYIYNNKHFIDEINKFLEIKK